MAIDLAKLQVALEANSAQFTREMEKVNGRLDRFEKRASAAMRGIGRAFSALGGAAGAAALLKLEQDAFKFGSAIADAALQTGLGTTAIQELTFAALQFGLTEEQMTGALTRLAVKIGEVRTEGENAVPAFKRLGVSLVQTDGQLKSNEQIFREVVERLRAIPDQATRASQSFQIFGREAGPKFAELIGAGTAGLDEQAKRLRESGKILDEDYVAALKRTSDEISVLDRQISVNLTRAFGTNEPLVKLWKETLESATAALASWREQNAKAAEDTAIATAIFGKSVTRNTEVLQAAVKSANDYLTVLENIRQLGAPEAPPIPFQNFQPPLVMNTGQPETDEQRKKREKEAERDAERVADLARRAQEEHARVLEETRREVLLLTDAEAEAAKMRALVNELYAKGKIPQDAYLAFLEEANQKLDDLGEKDADKQISIGIEQAARNIQSFTASMVDAAMAGENMGDAIVASLRRIAAELLTSMALQGLGQQFIEWGFPKLGAAISGKKADGGPVAGGKSYIVGEEGPELFTPSVSGAIIPNGEFGGGKVTVNVDARGADPASAANILRAMGALEMRIYENLRRETAPA